MYRRIPHIPLEHRLNECFLFYSQPKPKHALPSPNPKFWLVGCITIIVALWQRMFRFCWQMQCISEGRNGIGDKIRTSLVPRESNLVNFWQSNLVNFWQKLGWFQQVYVRIAWNKGLPLPLSTFRDIWTPKWYLVWEWFGWLGFDPFSGSVLLLHHCELNRFDAGLRWK